MDTGSKVCMNFTPTKSVVQKHSWYVYFLSFFFRMFIFINKIKSDPKVMGPLISVNWGHPTVRVICKYQVLTPTGTVGDGNAAFILGSHGLCCDPPVCANVKLEHGSLTISVYISFFTGLE